MPSSPPHDPIRAKMEAAAVARPAIDAFLRAVTRAADGDTGTIPEAHIEPCLTPLLLEELPAASDGSGGLLRQLAVIKLNGGLGTGMGLAGPKSLLPVRGKATFLDFIARQILQLRDAASGKHPAFLLMNSYNTQAESLAALRAYPSLPNADGRLDFLQNKVPKLDPQTLQPMSWPADPALEWCPPGHGDLYSSLLGHDNLLQQLLDGGIRYLFVSNADNLGATVDSRVLTYFAASGLSFLMEVTARTPMDRKGGHIARRLDDGRLLLREAAQCPAEDLSQFHDVNCHRFFNTNNLWIRLDHLQEAIVAGGGGLPLPLIMNRKPIDPQQSTSPTALQLESAMGAAIECFDRSGTVLVPRSRFAPVKSTSDLLAVRSDAYVMDADETLIQLDASREGIPPAIDLDARHYQLVDAFEELFPYGPPSLIDCRSLHVQGPVQFGQRTRIAGDVTLINDTGTIRSLPPGDYVDTTVEL